MNRESRSEQTFADKKCNIPVGYQKGWLYQKRIEKWKVCINYTKLNRACPKDCFPLHGLTN